MIRFTTRVPVGQLASVFFLAAVLTACGGGSGGGAVDDTSGNQNVGQTDGDGSNTADGGDGSGNNNGDTQSGAEDGVCSVADINRWVDERMRDTYIYYDQVPVVNLDDYTDPAELVRALRVSPDIYSSVVDQARDEQLISNSSVTRFGFWLQRASDGKQHFASIGGNSPMENAGIRRGDELLEINGVAIDEISDEQWNQFVVGERGEELTALFTVKSVGMVPEEISVTKTTYTEKTVPVFGTYDQTNNQVGYLQISSFRGTTTPEIDVAVQSFADAGISELILDLRYNGGGFTRVARKLASQIAGQAFVGEVYSQRVNNDKYSERNLQHLIESQIINLNLSRVIALTTDDTASASELIINGLAPMIDVVVIGTPSGGKPFTSVAQDYCGKRINVMSTITTNGIGESVIGGITPTCTVADDFLAPTDSPSDALTGAAFSYIQSGACPSVQSNTQRRDYRRG